MAFLDIDVELLAPRYRAAEQAMALLVRAARLVGPRAGGGRLLVQTFLPHHEVVQAALHADPADWSSRSAPGAGCSACRRSPRWPRVSGAGSDEPSRTSLRAIDGIDVGGSRRPLHGASGHVGMTSAGPHRHPPPQGLPPPHRRRPPRA